LRPEPTNVKTSCLNHVIKTNNWKRKEENQVKSREDHDTVLYMYSRTWLIDYLNNRRFGVHLRWATTNDLIYYLSERNRFSTYKSGIE